MKRECNEHSLLKSDTEKSDEHSVRNKGHYCRERIPQYRPRLIRKGAYLRFFCHQDNTRHNALPFSHISLGVIKRTHTKKPNDMICVH